MSDILVLGAGMVGVCTALELARRGHAVTLVDRKTPGQETSYGNAGFIQREAVVPYAFPRNGSLLLRTALKRGTDVNYHFSALPGLLPRLARYWHASAPERHAVIALEQAGAQELVRREGYRTIFRTAQAFDIAAAQAHALMKEYDLRCAMLDGTELARAEPGLHGRPAGAIHWLDPWTVSDPGALVARYAALLMQRGGRFVQGDAATLQPHSGGWRLQTADGPLDARTAVIALGPWSERVVASLGYRLPLFVKRGYHRHYTGGPGLRLPMLDAERGYVLAPMARGMRLTTGAEFARIDAPPTPRQLAGAERAARELLALPDPVEVQPWLGARPCTVDMKPITGRAPRHPNLWFNFGHAHQGFTLGPVSARLLADLIENVEPFIDAGPFAATRF
ncbi:MAG: amino acid dehydrogenase [Lautropia sp. SCN 66-9]|nr:MAG: amino acid dehydrogenase [Lautropia sp. SCN 66-9]